MAEVFDVKYKGIGRPSNLTASVSYIIDTDTEEYRAMTSADMAGGGGGTSDVNVLSSALPTGAATSALQTTGNSLTATHTKLQFGDSKITITNTTAVTGLNAYAVQIITDTVFTTLTDPKNSGGVLTGITIVAGTVLLGNFTAIQLTSGVVQVFLL